MRPSAILCPLLAAFGALGWSQETVSIDGRVHDGGTGVVRTAPATAFAGLSAAPEARLAPLETEPAGVVRQVRAARRVGRVRTVAADAVDKGTWTALPDGRWVWRLSIRSPEATELRIHFAGFAVGNGQVWVYSDDQAKAAQEFSGRGIYGDGDFWSSTVSAERVTIEYLPETGLREETLPFQIAEIGHLWEATSTIVTQSAPQSLSLAPAPQKAASELSAASNREIASCHLDVACFPEYRTVATGVARIVFSETGGVYVCSGALVNTKSAIGTPLFLTANHCIDNDAAARSVQANFFYESESCGGPMRKVEDVLGANYLVSQTFSGGDYSLIRLLGLPTSPVYFFGLSTEEPAVGTKLTGIHHPEGSYKRISFGPRTPDETIAVADDGGVYVSPADRFYQVDQREGRTEGGSSGSPLLNANKQIIGTLSSGPVFSANPAEDEVLMCLADQVIDQYGRVSKYWPGLETFVNDLRPAQMALPQVGDKFTAKKVTFQWSPGVGVTDYRLLVGKTKGGAEYGDIPLRKVTAYAVENLPEDGSPVYVRLMSLVEGKWLSSDYSYLASSGSPARAARILAPSLNGQISGSRVEFRWDEGSNVSEYMLYVGAVPGGAEFSRDNAGRRTSAVVDNLPGNGQTLYARIYSRVADRWLYNDAVYRAADTRQKTYTLTIANRLAYPVSVLVNEQAVMSVPAGRTGEQTLPRSGEAVNVQWRVVKPAHPVTGIAMGEAIGASFPAVVPADSLSFEITNVVNGVAYFTPVVTNGSTETFYVETNTGTPARAALGAIPPNTANAGLGYYRVQSTGGVRAYYGFYGYSGPYVETTGIAGKAEAGSGVVRVNLVPAQ